MVWAISFKLARVGWWVLALGMKLKVSHQVGGKTPITNNVLILWVPLLQLRTKINFCPCFTITTFNVLLLLSNCLMNGSSNLSSWQSRRIVKNGEKDKHGGIGVFVEHLLTKWQHVGRKLTVEQSRNQKWKPRWCFGWQQQKFEFGTNGPASLNLKEEEKE
jgi:hypothetical protein